MSDSLCAIKHIKGIPIFVEEKHASENIPNMLDKPKPPHLRVQMDGIFGSTDVTDRYHELFNQGLESSEISKILKKEVSCFYRLIRFLMKERKNDKQSTN